MRASIHWRCLLALLPLLAPVSLRAEVGDPTIRTDHPHYAGEGAFQTVDDCVRFATSGKSSPQDRAIAMYLWLLTHQWHLSSPQEWCVPGRIPDTAVPADYEMVVFDANRARFSYGYGLCGTVHAWNEPYWEALGMRARRRAFPGHVNSEVFYGGSWHAFDTDMAGLVFRRDGVVAGYDDIARDPALVDSTRPPLPHYPFAWPGDFEVMKRGWQQVAEGGSWYRMYNSGYAAHPAIVHLRSGESFTRWFDRDHFGGPANRRFWHNQKDGPFRNWAFFDNGEPFHDGAKSNARSSASYCNAEFVYEPDISGGRYREGVRSQTDNVARGVESPRLHSNDTRPAAVTFSHFSPYVICGDPADDANPMSGRATGGLVVEGRFVGEVAMEVSSDEGLSWQRIAGGDVQRGERVPPARGETRAGSPVSRTFDLTEQVKGRYGWQVRFSWEGRAGIDFLRFTTVTQVCQSIYPRLKPNGSRITYNCASRSVVALLPNFGLPESAASKFEATSLRSANVVYRGRSEKSRLAYHTTDNQPGTIVFPVEAPGRLIEVRAAVRYQIRVPPPETYDYRLDVSLDRGRTWTTFARGDIPRDNEFSSGWLAGRADVFDQDVKQALVRVHLYAGGHQTGLIDAQLYGVYQVAEPRPLTITIGWHDGTRLRTHEERIPARTTVHEFNIATSGAVTDRFIRMSAP